MNKLLGNDLNKIAVSNELLPFFPINQKLDIITYNDLKYFYFN